MRKELAEAKEGSKSLQDEELRGRLAESEKHCRELRAALQEAPAKGSIALTDFTTISGELQKWVSKSEAKTTAPEPNFMTMMTTMSELFQRKNEPAPPRDPSISWSDLDKAKKFLQHE